MSFQGELTILMEALRGNPCTWIYLLMLWHGLRSTTKEAIAKVFIQVLRVDMG